MATTRDPVLDNARAVLVALVVIGHVIGFSDPPAGRPLYLWIYTFHMAGFVIVSGMLSQRFGSKPADWTRVVTTLLVPYVIFQAIMLTIRAVRSGNIPEFPDLLMPAFALWFLLALAAWRVWTPVLRRVRGMLPIAVGIAVVVPVDPGLDQLGSLARALGFLPFFVLGLQLRPEHLTLLRRPAVRVLAGAGLVTGLVLAFVVRPELAGDTLQLDSSYADSGAGPLTGMAVRLVVLVAGTLGGLAVLAVSSSRRRWYTGIGERSLTVYLLHAVALYSLRDLVPTAPGAAGVVLAVVVGLALTVVLGSPWVSKATRWLTAPPVAARLVRPDGGEPSTVHPNGR